MNKNIFLYGALGFLVVRYLIKQKKTAAANGNTINTVELAPMKRTSL